VGSAVAVGDVEGAIDGTFVGADEMVGLCVCICGASVLGEELGIAGADGLSLGDVDDASVGEEEGSSVWAIVGGVEYVVETVGVIDCPFVGLDVGPADAAGIGGEVGLSVGG
jgi:hypothetical protein